MVTAPRNCGKSSASGLRSISLSW